jgi:hypothetical protein
MASSTIVTALSGLVALFAILVYGYINNWMEHPNQKWYREGLQTGKQLIFSKVFVTTGIMGRRAKQASVARQGV